MNIVETILIIPTIFYLTGMALIFTGHYASVVLPLLWLIVGVYFELHIVLIAILYVVFVIIGALLSHWFSSHVMKGLYEDE